MFLLPENLTTGRSCSRNSTGTIWVRFLNC